MPAKKPPDDVQALIEALRPVRVGRDNYSRLDRYREFHAVFHGSDVGKRVLAQIVDLLEGPPVIDSELGDHPLLAARAMGRRHAHTILSWASVPPTETGQEAKPKP